MGENEQGGMLRNVVVIGIIAMVALIITLGVVGLKSNMSKNTDTAVGAIVTKPIPFANGDKSYDVQLKPGETKAWWGNYQMALPRLGDVPNNHWREVHITLSVDKRTWFRLDVNTSGKNVTLDGNGWPFNDNDVVSKRHMDLYKAGSLDPIKSSSGNELTNATWMEPNTDYTIVLKYLNKSGFDFVEPTNSSDRPYYTILGTGNDDGSKYNLHIKTIEAATYDEKYVN